MFNYKFDEDNSDIAEKISKIASNMNKYPINEVLYVDYMFTQFDKDHILNVTQ